MVQYGSKYYRVIPDNKVTAAAEIQLVAVARLEALS